MRDKSGNYRKTRLALAVAVLFTALPSYNQQPQSSTVIFYRRGGLWSKALDFPLSLDGKAIGSIHNGIYFRVSAAPGQHAIAVGGSLLTQGDNASLKTIAGETYYIRVDNVKGMHEHVAIKIVSPEAAEKDLSGLKEVSLHQLN